MFASPEADEASDNSDEYAERVAHLARIALSAPSAGQPPKKRQRTEVARAATTGARHEAMRAAREALAATHAPQLALAVAVTDAAVRDDAMRHPFVRRYVALLGSAHAMLAMGRDVAPASDPLQRLLARGAARPPWPDLATPTAARAAWSLAEARALLGDHLNVHATGCLRLAPTAVALVGEWLTDGAPAGVALALVLVPAAANADLFAGDVTGVLLARVDAKTADAPGAWWYSHMALVDRCLLDAAIVGV